MQENNTVFENLMSDFLAGTLSDKDKVQLFALIDDSEELEKEYKERIRLYALLQVPALEKQKDKKTKEFAARMENRKQKKTINWNFYLRGSVAAIILMAIASFASILFYKNQMIINDSEQYYETVVPLGSQTKLILPDGSIAVLNSGSILKYNLSFGKKERNVTLKGEAYFEVTKDASKQFQVNVEDLKVQVTGTKFNVRSYHENQSIEVDLIEGGVNVVSANKTIKLLPDEKAIYNQLSGELTKKSVEAYKAATWTTGRLSFVTTYLTDILKDIERTYNVKIHVESEQVAKENFSITIDLNMKLDDVLRKIDVDKKYLFEREGDVIILKDK